MELYMGHRVIATLFLGDFFLQNLRPPFFKSSPWRSELSQGILHGGSPGCCGVCALPSRRDGQGGMR